MFINHFFHLNNIVANYLRRLIAPEKAKVCIYGIKLNIKPKSDIGFNLFYYKKFEFDEILASSAMCLARFRSQKFTILDVGSNIGIHSLFLADLCSHAKIIAFEPDPSTFAQLEMHIKDNKMETIIKPINIALSDVVGTADFFVTSDNAYNGLKDTNRKKLFGKLPVKVNTIDNWVKANDLPPIGLIKIDVEGLEHQVINGARGTIARYKPILVIEIYRGTDSNSDPDATIKTIINMGYDPYIIRKGLLKQFKLPHSDQYYNYFFVPTDLELDGVVLDS